MPLDLVTLSEINLGERMTTSEFFSADYAEARSKFLDAAQSAGADTTSFQHPSTGPTGDPLFIDVARFGPSDAEKIFLTISGVHGVEGFCGSGVQVGSLREGFHRTVPKGIALLMVHALNPYGFAWLRRTTHEGVDLYRNFLDFSKPLPENPVYDLLAQAFVPKEWTGPAREEADKIISDYIKEHGASAYMNQVPIGQYKYPASVFYGGTAPTWSNETFMQILNTHLTGAKAIAAIDYHTGLGENGEGQLLCFHQPESEAYYRAEQWWGESLKSVYTGQSVAYPITGGIFQYMESMLADVDLTAAAYEFGTLPPRQVMDALRGDNWLHNYGTLESKQANEIQKNMRDAFYCDNDQWRESIWKQSVAAQEAALKNLSDG